MTNERSRETNIGSLVLFDLSTLRSAIDGRYGDDEIEDVMIERLLLENRYVYCLTN